MTAVLPLMENVLTPFSKNVLIQLRIMAAASAMDAAIQKKIYGSATVSLIILNEEMEDIIKLVKPLKESGLLIIGVNETIKNEAK